MNTQLHLPFASERDWTEDFKHENGQYMNMCCICNVSFIGYKRRVVCRLCTNEAWRHDLEQGREDGLDVCTVCGGAEGAMPTNCPGVGMTGDQLDDVYAGTLDFVAGLWVQP